MATMAAPTDHVSAAPSLKEREGSVSFFSSDSVFSPDSLQELPDTSRPLQVNVAELTQAIRWLTDSIQEEQAARRSLELRVSESHDLAERACELVNGAALPKAEDHKAQPLPDVETFRHEMEQLQNYARHLQKTTDNLRKNQKEKEEVAENLISLRFDELRNDLEARVTSDQLDKMRVTTAAQVQEAAKQIQNMLHGRLAHEAETLRQRIENSSNVLSRRLDSFNRQLRTLTGENLETEDDATRLHQHDDAVSLRPDTGDATRLHQRGLSFADFDNVNEASVKSSATSFATVPEANLPDTNLQAQENERGALVKQEDSSHIVKEASPSQPVLPVIARQTSSQSAVRSPDGLKERVTQLEVKMRSLEEAFARATQHAVQPALHGQVPAIKEEPTKASGAAQLGQPATHDQITLSKEEGIKATGSSNDADADVNKRRSFSTFTQDSDSTVAQGPPSYDEMGRGADARFAHAPSPSRLRDEIIGWVEGRLAELNLPDSPSRTDAVAEAAEQLRGELKAWLTEQRGANSAKETREDGGQASPPIVGNNIDSGSAAFAPSVASQAADIEAAAAAAVQQFRKEIDEWLEERLSHLAGLASSSGSFSTEQVAGVSSERNAAKQIGNAQDVDAEKIHADDKQLREAGASEGSKSGGGNPKLVDNVDEQPQNGASSASDVTPALETAVTKLKYEIDISLNEKLQALKIELQQQVQHVIDLASRQSDRLAPRTAGGPALEPVQEHVERPQSAHDLDGMKTWVVSQFEELRADLAKWRQHVSDLVSQKTGSNPSPSLSDTQLHQASTQHISDLDGLRTWVVAQLTELRAEFAKSGLNPSPSQGDPQPHQASTQHVADMDGMRTWVLAQLEELRADLARSGLNPSPSFVDTQPQQSSTQHTSDLDGMRTWVVTQFEELRADLAKWRQHVSDSFFHADTQPQQAPPLKLEKLSGATIESRSTPSIESPGVSLSLPGSGQMVAAAQEPILSKSYSQQIREVQEALINDEDFVAAIADQLSGMDNVMPMSSNVGLFDGGKSVSKQVFHEPAIETTERKRLVSSQEAGAANTVKQLSDRIAAIEQFFEGQDGMSPGLADNPDLQRLKTRFEYLERIVPQDVQRALNFFEPLRDERMGTSEGSAERSTSPSASQAIYTAKFQRQLQEFEKAQAQANEEGKASAQDGHREVQNVHTAVRGVQRESEMNVAKIDDLRRDFAALRKHIDAALPQLLCAIERIAQQAGFAHDAVAGESEGGMDSLHKIISKVAAADQSAPHPFVSQTALQQTVEKLQNNIQAWLDEMQREISESMRKKADYDALQPLAMQLASHEEEIPALRHAIQDVLPEPQSHRAAFSRISDTRCASCDTKVDAFGRGVWSPPTSSQQPSAPNSGFPKRPITGKDLRQMGAGIPRNVSLPSLPERPSPAVPARSGAIGPQLG